MDVYPRVRVRLLTRLNQARERWHRCDDKIGRELHDVCFLRGISIDYHLLPLLHLGLLSLDFAMLGCFGMLLLIIVRGEGGIFLVAVFPTSRHSVT